MTSEEIPSTTVSAISTSQTSHRSPVAWATPESRYVVIRLWHPWLRINRVLRVMLHTRWSAEAWAQVMVEFRKALAVRNEIRRAAGSTN